MSWEFDATHSEIGFSVKHMMISTVRGTFSGIESHVELDPEHLERSRIRATIEVGTINTGAEPRDEHLRSGDFFDVATYPHMKFESTSLARRGNKLTLQGNLTIRDKTNPVTLEGTIEGPTKDPWGNQRVGFSLSGELDREAYGLTWNQALETGGVLVSKTVKVHIEAQAVAK